MHTIMFAMRAKVYEPVQRNKDGMRWVRHRFPIHGGISSLDVIAANLRKPNPLLRLFDRPKDGG